MVTNKCWLVLIAATAAAYAIPAAAAEYQIINYPALQNGINLSGTINADDLNNNTVLDPAELSSWTLTIDGSTVTSSDQDAASLVSNVSISGGMIFLEDPRVSEVEEQFILAIALEEFVHYFNGPHTEEFNDQIYNGRAGPVPSPTWSQQTLSTDGPNLPMPVSNGRMVIARIVPEPGALALLIVGGLPIGFALRRGSRR